MSRISIIIPTYNCGDFLIRTLVSLESQTYHDFEVIIVDDGSTDDTSNLLDQYQRLSPRFPIKRIKQDHKGSNSARNNGFGYSKGEYLLFLDADKRLTPNALERFLQTLEENPTKSYAYCHFKRDGQLFKSQPFDPLKMKSFELLIDVCALIKRKDFINFDEKLKRLQDLDLWLTLFEKGSDGILIPEILFETNSRPGDITSTENLEEAFDYIVQKHESLSFEIALITENCGHYSGGRYYAWMLAHALKEAGCNIIVCTNMMPVFDDDFKQYVDFPIKIAPVEKVNIRANCYISTPVYGNIRAVQLAKKFKKPCYCIVFDPLLQIKQYVPEDWEMEKEYFSPMIPFIKEKFVNIICLTEFGKKSIIKWLNKTLNQVSILYPRVNILKTIQLLSISRIVNRKNYKDLLDVMKLLPNNYKLKIISSIGTNEFQKEIEKMGLCNRIELIQCNDEEKFRLIASADIMVNTSLFEGFGMWAIEARSFNKPVVCYDFPTIREIINKGETDIYLVERRNIKAFVNQIMKIKPPRFNSIWSFDQMVNDICKIFNLKEKKNIGWIADFFIEDHPGGAQRTNEEIIKHAPEYGFKITKIKTTLIDNYTLSEFDFLILNNIRYLQIDKLKEIIEKYKYIRYEHDYLDTFLPEKLVQEIFDRAILNIFLSPLHFEIHDKKYKIRNIYIQPSPVDTDKFYIRNKEQNNRILYAGGIALHKGIINLFDYARRNPEKMIDLYGWIEDPDLINHLESNCFYKGAISYDEMPELYQKYSFFIHLPIWEEPFGRTIIEAYLSGCQLITNNNIGCLSYGWNFGDYQFIKQKMDEAPHLFWKKIKSLSF